MGLLAAFLISALLVWPSDALTFGTGTKLIVEPAVGTPVAPSVFVLKPQKGDSPTACLVKDFTPKEDVEIYMNSTQSNSGIISASPVVSLNGTYSAVHVDRLGTEGLHCQAKHKGKWFRDLDTPLEAKEISPDPTEASAIADPDQKCEQPAAKPATPALSNERINILSVTVLGMRLLFAKTLAFNLLLTAKFFLL
ncbi:hypothetical protein XENTR_v10002077 [Xenopus tropicalis]|nr:hypothetical protein XENTR_v10002077 [Xenopus tropicalis]